ncbi:DNA-directed RNA polymerase, mitochondrial [Neolecta irregularis DAH-3]|uniref:DNA-directed RNA polymerase n=1 Tax=Neolecta irregularis (strain DAH-3) TaxID=1198029 RepID=A0A1U7LJ26_NEOID|nr:DNA-directed RNA polymerase, mitochondrial [Neolecta irregularis DAH-3]|eukprot:OLL22655.1 DNA-directed RNA polymerase, mitochondrial [Neolecta irregularis DAH-3]
MLRVFTAATASKFIYPARWVAVRGYAAAATAVTQIDHDNLLILTFASETRKTRGIILGNKVIQIHSNDALSFFDVSLSLNDFDRARSILLRLEGTVSAPDLLAACNKYLYATAIESTKYKGDIGFVAEWLDIMERTIKVSPDARTFALLIKTCLDSEEESFNTWTMRYYLKLFVAKGGSYSAILDEESILTEEDVRKIMNIMNFRQGDLSERYRSYLSTKEEKLADIPPVEGCKGPGLELLRQAVSPLTDSSAEIVPLTDLSPEDIHKAVTQNDDFLRNLARQKALEAHAMHSALEKWRFDHEQMKKLGIVQTGGFGSLLLSWYQALLPAIEEELACIAVLETKIAKREQLPLKEMNKYIHGKFISLLTPEKLAVLTVMELVKAATTGDSAIGLRTTHALIEVGQAVESEIVSLQLQKKENSSLLPRMNMKPSALLRSDRAFSLALKIARKRAEEQVLGVGEWRNRWSEDIQLRVGAFLTSMFLRVAKFEVTHYKDTGEKGKKLGILKWCPEVMARFAHEPLAEAIHPKQLPMLIPPRPWISYSSGAYYYSISRVLRSRNSDIEQNIYTKKASELGNLDTIFAALNVLGDTCWSINRKVFDVILQVWNTGKAFATIPSASPELELPPEPQGGTNPIARAEWVKTCQALHNEHSNLHSRRCDLNYKMEIARAFIGERMYFPHNLDFRGRAYPIPPHFNHLGDDLSRGLLNFYEGKELGESGFRWLKIHLANVYGYDKASFSEREDFAMQHLTDIFDSADNPLDGKSWWQQAEDPWQCFATCLELTEALRSPDPHKFISYLPVHQDGTCNGLQHYAALGGDPLGAQQVNLTPSERPHDIYTRVAELVAAQVNKDADAGNPSAKLVQGKISRKLVKRTVMTNVYGVTFIGARDQIATHLKLTGFDRDNAFVSPRYISPKFKIQNWLSHAARIICKSIPREIVEKGAVKNTDFQASVIWTTPLNLPVVQPYRAPSRRQVCTTIQTCYIDRQDVTRPVHFLKQKNAFPPNFIHSLDATHMLMSALACNEKNLTYAAVHDSYWTHATDVDTMNVVLREAFIDLHQQDIMEKLKKEMEERYKNHKTYYTLKTTSPYYNRIRSSLKKLSLAKRVKNNVERISQLKAEFDKLTTTLLQDEYDIELVGAPKFEELEVDASDEAEVEESLETKEKTLPDIDETTVKGETKPRISDIKFWVNLTFPPIPRRGGFDVTQLRKSKYFFS